MSKNPEKHSFPMPIDSIYISTANDPKKKKLCLLLELNAIL
jgi:hypothetical protein